MRERKRDINVMISSFSMMRIKRDTLFAQAAAELLGKSAGLSGEEEEAMTSKRRR
jgi:hypothetical protein